MEIDANIKQQQSWPPWRLVMMGLNLLALSISILLSWHYLQGGSLIGCTGGSACEQVISSRWSTIGGVLPVSSLAMGVYLALLVAVFFVGPSVDIQTRKLAWNVLVVLAGSIVGSAIWFIIVQKWFIGSFCPYCMTAHVTGFILAALIVRQVLKQKKIANGDTNDSPQSESISRATKQNVFSLPVMGLIFIGLLTSGFLVAGQIAITPKTAYNSGRSQNTVTDIDYRVAPIVGSPYAPYVVKLLFDYQCPHCQKIHFMLNEAVRRYAGKLAFVLCPTPLNTQCNPYIPRDVDAFRNSCELAKIGMMVWAAKPEIYNEFENWMFTFDSGDKWKPRSLEEVRAKALELIGKEKLDDAANTEWANHYIQTCIQIYGQTLEDGKSGIPKLVYGSQWVIPEPNSPDEFIDILQKGLGIQ